VKKCNLSTEVEIKRFIIANFARDVTPDELGSDLNLLDSGVVDSLGLLRLIAWVGDNYHIPVNDANVSPDDFSSIDAIRSFIEESHSGSVSK
jgi:acyl carrier protein